MARPLRRQLRFVRLPELVVAGRLRNGVDRVRIMRDGEAHGERLVVGRLRDIRGVRFLRVAMRFGPGDGVRREILDELARLGGIDEIRCRQNGAMPGRMHNEHRLKFIFRVSDAVRDIALKNPDAACGDMRREHFPQRGQRRPRLVAQFRNAAVAGVQIRDRLGRLRERIVAAIVVADAIAEFAVALRAAAFLDPRVLVRRHGLRRELPADPIVLFGEDHLQAVAGGGERAGDAAQAAPDDRDLRMKFPWLRIGERRQGSQCGRERGECQEGAAVHGVDLPASSNAREAEPAAAIMST